MFKFSEQCSLVNQDFLSVTLWTNLLMIMTMNLEESCYGFWFQINSLFLVALFDRNLKNVPLQPLVIPHVGLQSVPVGHGGGGGGAALVPPWGNGWGVLGGHFPFFSSAVN